MIVTKLQYNKSAKRYASIILLLLAACSPAEQPHPAKPTITFPFQQRAALQEAEEERREREQAEQEDMFRLAEQYRYGRHLEQDINEAVRIYEALALKGNRQAIDELADAYGLDGWHYHHPRQAVYWWQKQAELGDVEAMVRLGSAYSRAYGVEPDAAKAKSWFNKAIQVDPAQRKAVALLLTKIDNNISQQLGLYYLRTAIAAHDRKSAYLLYEYYLTEPIDKPLLQQVADILQQDEEADIHLPLQLALGYQALGAYDASIDWLQLAAKSGVDEAMLYLANEYQSGLHIDRSPKLAVKWYLQAASKGNAQAQYQLGMAYARGLGVTQNGEKALYWLVKSGKMTMLEAQQQLDVFTAAIE